MLGYHLQKNLPDFHIQVIQKQEQEWNDYRSDLYQSKKWGIRLAADRTIKDVVDLQQLIYRPSGELIGLVLFLILNCARKHYRLFKLGEFLFLHKLTL